MTEKERTYPDPLRPQEVIGEPNRLGPIRVTEPSLPPLDELAHYLRQIWENRWLTNNGPIHQQLESALCEYLEVSRISLCANGTLGLILALKSLNLQGEVITTPYSFVATSHAIAWNDLTPVFVDVDRQNFNINPNLIEAAITPTTSAIVAVHCYGYPCDIQAIQEIADAHNLAVIYDAAHAFGVRYGDESLLTFGDASVLSFHATKVFTTFEGGAVVTGSQPLKERIDFLKNFGIQDEVTVVGLGINGKMNEFEAAVGLLQLRSFQDLLRVRRGVFEHYTSALSGIEGITLPLYLNRPSSNFGYYPVLIGSDFPRTRDQIYRKFRDAGIYARRYFYPAICDLPPYRELPSAGKADLPVARDLASHVVCLPIHAELTETDLARVVEVLASEQ